jgi:predicted metal-dependent HD superfamily phosphohydrolase
MREWLGLGMVFIPIGERLLARYSESGRHYHDARHILACLRSFDDHTGNIRDPDAVELALWFHDAVYDPKAPAGENEVMSGRYFRREFETLARGLIDIPAVERLILATDHRGVSENPDADLVADIDLGILGADPPRYDGYAADIRREYSHVPAADYRQGRARILRAFLDRQPIYRTRSFRQLLEKPARANLERELDALLLPR